MKNFLFIVSVFAVVGLFVPNSSLAAQNSVVTGGSNSVVTGGSNSVVTGGGTNCGTDTLCNPLKVNSIGDLIALLLHAAIIIGIPIAVLFIVWAGFKFILARGSPSELGEARNNLVATLIGVAIFIGASLIANVIIATLQQLGVQDIHPINQTL